VGLIVAADGGASRCRALGLRPDLVVGDFDSADAAEIEALARAGVEIRRVPAEKDESDLELALRAAIERGARRVIALGALGGPGSISGVWLMPAVIAALIVRKPGAALFAELVAAIVSALLGNVWGMDVVLSGFVQGTGAELVFAFTLYGSFGLPVALIAGGLAGVGEALHDLPVYYPSNGIPFQASVAILEIVSGAVIAGYGGWLLVRSLRRAGVLEGFPS
jgi:energy-coupling factor transport system substrate-specific component